MIFSLFPSKKFLGVDIGTSFIKIVELGRKGQKPNLENYGEAGIIQPGDKPFRLFEKDTLLLSNKSIAEAIKNVCKEAGIKTRDAVFSIPDFSTFFTTFSLPKMTQQELQEAIRYEVRPYIPIPLADVTLDWLITEGQAGKTPVKILAVAIPNDVIKQYQEVSMLSGLNIKFLEPEVFSLERAIRFLIKDIKVAVAVDIGARTTTCNILEQGFLKISHSFDINSNQLTDLLARSLNLEYNKAEELKIKEGITGDKKVAEIIAPLVDELAREIKRIIQDFYQDNSKEVEKVLLTGGAALLPGLKDYLSNELQKEVVIVNPFENIIHDPVLDQVFQEIGPAYSIVTGAALKGFE